ncbi:hypothetical protein J3R83DRAFT_4081 [Lanmaoa asiatica]|nr:hypothetical protein J3R83DRAFT_4081 [Lanmaoa asiatica]
MHPQLTFFGDIMMSYRKRVAKAKNTISIGLQNNLAELTRDANARVDYIRYERSVVQRYNVRLVGYTHDQWANPSDLKGGIDALEKLAKAVLEKKCYFVTISANEVTQRQECITNGEILTPNVDRTVPVTHNPKPTPPSALISVPSPQLTLPSALSAPSTAPQNNLPQPAHQNQATGLDTSNSTTATGHTDTMGNRHLDENVTLGTASKDIATLTGSGIILRIPCLSSKRKHSTTKGPGKRVKKGKTAAATSAEMVESDTSDNEE